MEYTIQNASDDFASLSNKVGRFKEELCKNLGLNFKSQDFRLIFLDAIQQYLLSLTSYIRAFVGLQKFVSADEFLKILNVVNVKDFSHPFGKDISYHHGKDISHRFGKQISHFSASRK